MHYVINICTKSTMLLLFVPRIVLFKKSCLQKDSGSKSLNTKDCIQNSNALSKYKLRENLILLLFSLNRLTVKMYKLLKSYHVQFKLV